MFKAVWLRIEEKLTALPKPLSQQAADLLQYMANRNRATGAKGYFEHHDSYPTPQLITWMGECYLPGEPRFVERILEAALWLFLYIRIQDDILDDASTQRDLLLLGNICVQQGFAELYRLLPEDKTFQAEVEAAWLAFSAATALEKINHWGNISPFTDQDLDLLGEKFAAIRLPISAILCRAGRADLILSYAQVLQNLGTAVQMTNDLNNWREDLEVGNFTYFLTQAGNDPAQAISGGVAVEECLTVAQRYLASALKALPSDGPEVLRIHLREREERLLARKTQLVMAKLGLTGG